MDGPAEFFETKPVDGRVPLPLHEQDVDDAHLGNQDGMRRSRPGLSPLAQCARRAAPRRLVNPRNSACH